MDTDATHKGEKPVYTKQQKENALRLYDQLGSVTAVIHQLAYPSRQAMYLWIENRNKSSKKKALRKKRNNSPVHPLHPSYEVKMNTIHRCFTLGDNVQLVAEEIGYSRASIYTWRKKFIREGVHGLMNPNDKPRGKVPEGEPSSTEEIKKLKELLQDMQLEIDILKETLNVLKKDPGVDIKALSNKEKGRIVDALQKKYSLPLLLRKLCFPRSSYYYHQQKANTADRYAQIQLRIVTLFHENKKRYGYRRIHTALQKEGLYVSEKIVRRIMTVCNLMVPCKRRNQRYHSYKGEITPSVPNLLERNFQADQPNVKWLTDVTEFAIPAGKIFLSPIVDCFDGLVTAWNMGTTPNATLVNTMLEEAIQGLKNNEKPIIHSDRGCHYRWPGWIERMTKADLTRSMSKKGCSPDNAACEGFFGRLKNELFYNQSWEGISLKGFMKILNEYIVWYNEKRIKLSLGGVSPLEYRQKLGYAT